MATLTKSTGTVTLSGAVEKVTFPAVYGWVWVKNMSDADMFVGLSNGISAGADGVMRIPVGECGRVQTDGQDSVYLIGSGNALVVAQNYADCPFKVGGKGGEIPDLSAYAKTADVPNIKVNAAVDADTVNGHSVNADVPADAKFTDTIPDLSPYAKKSDIPTELPANGGNADTVGNKHASDFAAAINPTFDGEVRLIRSGNNTTVPMIFAWEETIRIRNIEDESAENHTYTDLIVTPDGIYTEAVINGVIIGRTKIESGKPYITGDATVNANSNVCVSNHGFTPSSIIWWDGSLSGVAVSFSDTQFVMDKTSSVNRMVNYLIFK